MRMMSMLKVADRTLERRLMIGFYKVLVHLSNLLKFIWGCRCLLSLNTTLETPK